MRDQVELRAFLEGGLGIDLGLAEFIGWDHDGKLAAVIGFHNYHRDSGVIELSAYSSRRDWLSGAKVIELFGYPFDQLGVRVCVARHAEDNYPARRIWTALGAREYTIPELRGEGRAECLSVLHKRDWTNGKFMRRYHGKEHTGRTGPV